MRDWDYDYNDKGYGIITVYGPGYNDIRERTSKFYLKDLDWFLDDTKETYDSWKEQIEKEHFMIGINSNSFTGSNHHKHNLFLEWDNRYSKPNLEKLKELGGVITETKNGYHFIKEDNLSIQDLVIQQTGWACCPGFVKHTLKKEYACLRVSPKGKDNIIKIINYNDALLHNIYKEFVEKLGGIYEPIS